GCGAVGPPAARRGRASTSTRSQRSIWGRTSTPGSTPATSASPTRSSRSRSRRWASLPVSPVSDDEALRLANEPAAALAPAAAALRDRVWGRTITFSPKVFLPLTNLCRNRCDYCSFRRSPGDPGAHTMTPDEVEGWLGRARRPGAREALFCLGDKPESGYSAYRLELASFGHASTVDYLVAAGARALAHGLLPHTNAGILGEDDMVRLRAVNVSLGLMLENVSPRLCAPGMPHHRAPDKRPEKRLGMIAAAGRLKIPFTPGILIGIGETQRHRPASLLPIRHLHRPPGPAPAAHLPNLPRIRGPSVR